MSRRRTATTRANESMSARSGLREVMAMISCQTSAAVVVAGAWDEATRLALPYFDVNCGKSWPTTAQQIAAHKRNVATIGVRTIDTALRPDRTRLHSSPPDRAKATQNTRGVARAAAPIGSIRSR